MMGVVGTTGYDDGVLGNDPFDTGFQNVKVTDIEAKFTGTGGGPSSTITFADGYNTTEAVPRMDASYIFNYSQQSFSAPHFERVSNRKYPQLQPGYLDETGGKLTVSFMDGHARLAAPSEFPGGTGLASWQIAP